MNDDGLEAKQETREDLCPRIRTPVRNAMHVAWFSVRRLLAWVSGLRREYDFDSFDGKSDMLRRPVFDTGIPQLRPSLRLATITKHRSGSDVGGDAMMVGSEPRGRYGGSPG